MPYAKRKRHPERWIILIVLTLLAIVAAGLFAWHIHLEDQATRARLIEEATPRIVVPAGHFSASAVTEAAPAPAGIASVRVRPGIDFYTDPAADEATLGAELDEMLAAIADMGMNAVLVDTRWMSYNEAGQTVTDGRVIWDSQTLSAMPVDALRLLTERAAGLNLRVGVAFHVTDIAAADGSIVRDHLEKETRFLLGDAAAELAAYPVATVQLEDYYPERTGKSFLQFMQSQEPVEYEAWLRTNVERTIAWVRDAVHTAKPDLAVGIAASAVWANQDTNESGSATQASFQALTSGHADTKALVESGGVDFVSVSVSTSRVDPNVPFETAVGWWDAVCSASGVPLYVSIAAENACTDLVGWNGMDELSRQTIIALESASGSGVNYTGLPRLQANPNGSTQYLTQYLEGKVSAVDVETDLTVYLPEKYSFVTYEEEQQFRLKYDPNQPVYLNGEQLVPTERGGVSVWKELEVGMNVFTLEHKGQTRTYKIERKVIIFDSWNPTEDMKVAGGSKLEFSVKAYKGSAITATIAGETIQLREVGNMDDDMDSSYVTYIGSWTVPKATAKEQPLGQVIFSGSYKGYQETKSGANITIDKMADEVDPDEMTGQIYTHAIVTDDYAFVYPYKTAPEYAESILYQLPEGTMDVVVSRNGDFLNLRSGKTVKITTGTDNKETEIMLEDLEFQGNNHVTAMTLGVEGDQTVIRMTMDWKAPFSIDLSPYPTEVGDSRVSTYTFAADQLTILLDYTTVIDPEQISGSLDGSPIFSGLPVMERVRNEEYGIWQYKLTLDLNRVGRYYGCYAAWEGNDLVLRFNHPPESGTLYGLTVMIDAGHGGNDPGTMAGADVLEKDVNLSQAQKVASALEDLGATVLMIRDGDTAMDIYDRPRMAHAANVGMYLSIHHNSAGSNSTPNGIEVYYNTPFSQPLGQYVYDYVSQEMTGRGLRIENFLVARDPLYPSLLIECGYLSNPGDELLAQDEQHQWNIAYAIAQGVLDYYMAFN